MLLFSEECSFNLSFHPFFFCSGYATGAPAKRKNHIATHARAKFFPQREDCSAMCLTSVQPGCASETMRELRSAPVIAHNMAALVYEKDI
jgi:hypothetical protein